MADSYADVIYNDAWSWMTDEERKEYKKTHAQMVIEQAIKRKSGNLFQQLIGRIENVRKK